MSGDLAHTQSDRALRHLLHPFWSAALDSVEGAREGSNPEFLHDLRVAIRRTRAALSETKAAFAREELDPLRSELAWLGRRSGPTRDLDVLLENVPVLCSELAPDDARALDALLAELREQRDETQRALAQELAGERVRELFNIWGQFVAVDKHHEGAPPASEPKEAGRLDLAQLAAGRIRRRHKRFVAAGRTIDEQTPAKQLHDLRIAGKKLRYLLELFRPIYGRPRSAALLGTLKRLQDVLGGLNDCAVQEQTLEGCALSSHQCGRMSSMGLIATGRLLERIRFHALELRSQFSVSFAAFDTAENAASARALFADE